MRTCKHTSVLKDMYSHTRVATCAHWIHFPRLCLGCIAFPDPPPPPPRAKLSPPLAMVPLRLSLPGTSSDCPLGLKALSRAPGTVLFVPSPITMPDMQQVFLRYERMNDKSSKERA